LLTSIGITAAAALRTAFYKNNDKKNENQKPASSFLTSSSPTQNKNMNGPEGAAKIAVARAEYVQT
jgi:hypothetical protein